jgi:hypothetical protein
MVFFGFCPENFMNEHWGRVASIDPVHLYQYMSRLAQLNLDLMLYPLMDHQFNYSKSNIRWLESSMIHVPVISSPIHSYRDIGEDLCMTVPLTYEAWFNALEHAYLNRDDMRARAEKSREWARAHWSIQAGWPAWAAVLAAAATGEFVAQDFTPPPYPSKQKGDSHATRLDVSDQHGSGLRPEAHEDRAEKDHFPELGDPHSEPRGDVCV